MPPLARITGTGVNPPIIISPTAVIVTETDTGYKAEVEPPTGKTAQELVDASLMVPETCSKTRSTLLTRT